MKSIFRLIACTIIGIAAPICAMGTTGTRVPMTLKDSKTFYVTGSLAGVESAEFMVDTGSSYMTINQAMLDRLKTNGQAAYRRELTGVLANGAELVVPVYRIPRIVLGGSCEIFDVEAVVFPGETRQILGLNVLRKAAPFLFSTDPPALHLSHCNGQSDP